MHACMYVCVGGYEHVLSLRSQMTTFGSCFCFLPMISLVVSAVLYTPGQLACELLDDFPISTSYTI